MPGANPGFQHGGGELVSKICSVTFNGVLTIAVKIIDTRNK